MNDESQSAIEVACSQHARLRRIIGEIGATAPELPANIGALLDELADALRTHLQLEDEFVYPRLCSSENAVLRRKARRYQFHMGGIAEGFAFFHSRWTANGEIASHTARFWEDWKILESALLQRMESEDDDLYRSATEEHRRSIPPPRSLSRTSPVSPATKD